MLPTQIQWWRLFGVGVNPNPSIETPYDILSFYLKEVICDMPVTTYDLGKVMLTPRGEYNPSVQYYELDVVTYSGSSFLVLKDVIGVTPVTGEFYQVLAEKGSKGDRGAQGYIGPRGETGPEGPQGPQGVQGEPGEDGGYYTPSVTDTGVMSFTASKSGMPALDPVDLSGIRGEAGPEGPAGPAGTDGGYYTPVIDGDGNLSWTGSNPNMDPIEAVNIRGPQGPTGPAGADGPQGIQGEKGEPGGYYTPSVSEDGMLTWTPSDESMPAIESVNITGPAGPQGAQGDPGQAGGYYTPSVDEDGNLSWTASDEGMPELEPINISGIRGPQGEQGVEGPAGPAGADGEDGGYYTPSVADDGTLTWTPSDESMPQIEPVNIKGPQGEAGTSGENGGYYTPSVSEDGTLSWTPSDDTMASVESINIRGPQGEPGAQGEKGDPGNDGADGGYYTPAVDAEGNLTWTGSNAEMTTVESVNIKGPKGDTGLQGPKGEDGTSITILGSYETEEALKAAHPTGQSGNGYIVGTDLYVWSETLGDWDNVGRIEGPQGDKGEDGGYYTPAVSEDGTLSWAASDESMPVIESINIMGPAGPQGEKGEPGESVEVDTTLTQAGQAADAKAVGDALANMVSMVDTIIINGGTSAKS